MKKSILAKALLGLSFLALSSVSSLATIVWDLNPGNLNGNVGSPSTSFSNSGFSITATGWDHNAGGSDSHHLLWYKDEPAVDGATEHGLGLFNTNANELNIDPNGFVPHYIQLDLRSILALGFTDGQIACSSMQNGEGFNLYGSNVAGQLGTQLAGTWTGLAFDNQFVSIPQFGQFQFISIAANSGRIIPAFFSAVTPVPEMSTLLPIVGLVGLISSSHLVRRRRSARQTA